MPTIDMNQARSVTEAKEKEYGLPPDTLFKIGGIESSFNGGAVSPKGARGYFQFMEPTARSYGVNVGDFHSEADGAARYMRDNLKKYGGNMDMALADYNGGPKAAAALAKGKPWPETQDYLNKFYGKPRTPLSSQFTTGGSANDGSVSPSSSELYKLEQQQEADSGGIVNNVSNLPGAISNSFQLDNSVYNFFKTKGLENVDPNFQWTKDLGEQVLKNIPQDHWEYVLQAKSAQEANDRRARVLDSLEKEKELSKMGVAGVMGRIGTGLVDLPTLIAFVPGMGGEGLLTATSRISNAVRMGLVGAASNVAFDAAAMSYKPLSTSDDLYASALAGLGLGALGGAAINPAKVGAMRLAKENADLAHFGRSKLNDFQLKEFNDNGLKLTADGDALFKKFQQSQDEVRLNIDRQSEIARRQFKFDSANDNNLKNVLEQEVKDAPPVPPTFDRGRVSERDFGAEDITRSHLFRNDAANPKVSAEEWISNNFTFLKNGKISGITAGTATKLSLADLKTVGIATKDDLLHVVNKLRLDQNYQKLVRFAQKGSTMEWLDRLAKSTDERIAPLAERAKGQLITDVPVYTIRQKDIDVTFGGRPGKYGGFYDSTRHAIFVPEGVSEQVMLHEINHALTVHKLDYGFANPNTVHGQLAAELKSLFEEASAVAKKKGYQSYYLTNVKEFTAGIYSGKMGQGFHSFLAAIKTAENTSLLSKVVDVFRKLLGYGENETNAFLKALDLTDRLASEKLTVKMDRGEKLGVDTIHFAPTSSAVEPEVAVAASKAGLNQVFGWGLGLESKLGNGSVPQAVRDLASKLFGTTVGYKDHSVVKANAWDDTTKWSQSWTTQLKKETIPAFNEWFEQSGKKWHEKGQAYEEFGTQVSNYVRGVEGDYPKQVVKAGESYRKTMAKIVDYVNNPLLDEGGNKKGLTMQEIRDPETGTVTLEGGLEKNPNYMPRKHDVNKWNSLVNQFGRDAVEGWWARAHMAGREGVSEEAAAKFAKWYVRSVDEAYNSKSQEMLDGLLRGQDREALKHSLVTNGGYSEFDAQKFIDDMFPTKNTDTGRTTSSLKNRNTIDEKFSETWTLPDGTKQEISLNNFVNTNAFEVAEGYIRRMASSVALAKHLDVYKTGDIDRLVADATANSFGTNFKNAAHQQSVMKDLQFAFDRIQGVPQEEFTKFNKSMSMWRDFNVIRLMGGAVWNQATEMSQIIGSMGWKATLGAVPELRTLSRDMATGKIGNEILEHLENTIGGAGSEYIERMSFTAKDDWVRNVGDTKYNRWLDNADNAMKKMAKGVLDYTGMTPLMIQQKRVHSIALVNHFINEANGKISSSFLTKDRLAWMGLSESDTARLYDNLKKFSKSAKGEYSSSYKVDFDKWIASDPESHSKFMTAIHRESRRVIQENDLASMVPIMGSTLGKTVFQFMNFTMHGWNKSLMFAMNHRDWTTMSTVLHGGFLASLAYMGRTQVNAIGMDAEKRRKYLDERMNAKQIVANSFGRISQASLLPNIYDTVSPYPMFNGMRTTADLTSMASNPTYQAVNGVISLKKLIRNGTSDQFQTTSQDIKTWGRLLPLNNVAPISSLLNSLANEYPHNEKQ